MKCGLVLEGGARRGLFTAGFLDRLYDFGVEFPYVAGVSAGAQAAMNFVSRQPGRSKFMMIPHNDAKTPVLPLHDVLARELNKIAFDYSYNQFPFDFTTYFTSDTECEIVATDCLTGGAEYFSERKDEKRLLKALVASCSLPALFPKAEVDGREFVDGSIADSVPFQRAFEKGCDRVLVVLTKPEDEPATDYRKMRLVLSKIFEEEYPRLFDAMMTRFDRYAEQAQLMGRLADEGKIMVVRPKRSYVKAFDTNFEKLETAYDEGKAAADTLQSEILEFTGYALRT